MLWEILAGAVISLFLSWLAIRYYYNRQLNKLRRKYVESEDKSRGKYTTGIGPASENRFGQAGTGNQAAERSFEQIRAGRAGVEPVSVQSDAVDRSPEAEKWNKPNNGLSRNKFRRI